MKTLIILWAFVYAVSSGRETHRFVNVLEDGQKIHQDIIHDEAENTVMVIVGDVSDRKGSSPSVNLHDFNTGYVAFKDIRKDMCLLSRTPYPRAMPEVYRMGSSNISMHYKAVIDPKRIGLNEVETTAGSTIATFCKDYVTYRTELILIRPEVKRDEFETLGCTAFCFICWIEYNEPKPVSDEPVIG